MEAIVLAGGITNERDPLYMLTGEMHKAFLPIGQKPMVQWVLDALNDAESISGIHVIGISQRGTLYSGKPMTFTKDHGGILENVKAGFNQTLSSSPNSSHVLITSSDIPLITGQMVDWRVNTALTSEVDYDLAVVKRSVMEQRFPGSNRTYTRFVEAEVCGADINIIRIQTIDNEALWQRLISARKNPLTQARFIGFSVLLKLLIRRLSLSSAELIASDRLGLRGKVRFSPYAEIAMDVDKPHQYEIIQKEFLALRDETT